MPVFSLATSASDGGSFSSSMLGIRGRDHAHHDRVGAALPEDVHAKAGARRDRVGEVGGAVGLQRVERVAVTGHQIECDSRGVFRRQDFQALGEDRSQLAMALDLQRAAR